MSTCVTGNIDLHSRDTVRTCARASRRKVIVHGGKREYALHKTRPPSRLLAPLYSATRTHAVLVSPIPLPYVTPYSPPRLFSNTAAALPPPPHPADSPTLRRREVVQSA